MSLSVSRHIGSRIVGALRLDPPAYEEVESDGRATLQALIMVVVVSAAVGVGFPAPQPGLLPLVAQTAASLVTWVVWSALVYLLGVHVFPVAATRSSLGELLRTTGFSTAPGLLMAFGRLPRVGGIIFAVAAVWMLIAMLVAVRQALDYSSLWRAIAVCGAAWLLSFTFLVVMGLLFATPVF